MSLALADPQYFWNTFPLCKENEDRRVQQAMLAQLVRLEIQLHGAQRTVAFRKSWPRPLAAMPQRRVTTIQLLAMVAAVMVEVVAFQRQLQQAAKEEHATCKEDSSCIRKANAVPVSVYDCLTMAIIFLSRSLCYSDVHHPPQ